MRPVSAMLKGTGPPVKHVVLRRMLLCDIRRGCCVPPRRHASRVIPRLDIDVSVLALRRSRADVTVNVHLTSRSRRLVVQNAAAKIGRPNIHGHAHESPRQDRSSQTKTKNNIPTGFIDMAGTGPDHRPSRRARRTCIYRWHCSSSYCVGLASC